MAGNSGGGSGGGGGGGAGTAGTDSVVHDCEPQTSIPAPPSANVHDTYVGGNGTFSDSCDPSGNLIAHDCESTMITGSPTDPGPFYMLTGDVAEELVNCDGRCVNGTCPNICPGIGDSLRYVTIEPDGSATFDDLTNGLSYQCQLYGMAEGYDCKTMPMVGDVAVVSENFSDDCPADPFIYTYLNGVLTCSYDQCDVIEP